MKIRLIQNGLITQIDDLDETRTPPAVGFYWIDATLFDLDVLQPLFGLHDLAIDDCLDEEEQRPKLEIYHDHYFIVINNAEFRDQDIFLREVNIFLGSHYIITVSKHPHEIYSRLLQIVREEELNRPDAFLYHLVDQIVDRYFEVVEHIEELIEKLEEDILLNVHKTQLNQIVGLRSEVLYARKMLLPQRDLIDALHTKELPLIEPRLRKYFGDILENAVKIVESFDTFRDLISNLREAYHSAVAGRTNDIMRIFTALTTIFMPLTIVTGIYGMNFEYMPELKSPFGYYLVLAFMAALGLTMFWIFKRKKWL
ncbi:MULTISPECIES: magnesium/cobalt transporter CorA [Bacillales]|jgi:magnesium transporter|uniref:Magnesium transport protein CorA n=1 Tax=Brevibacillus aydinogluensis TaxID=927786 RepID=A0AA48M511_9BACL|nr:MULTISPECIES: magnesium/cobalt transporter CorA [Bacillales]REK65283.1 MAG: magnesium and cobalt transport protein CorA [Brevibacillus sp.]MBR8661685.1 magnesium/cobalt transporter CorA [Brevibacillus sp. NL20B1]MDT3415849.1 magnesium transporter [Brevibacillus aydinogluensis]NNV03931.1 magnesium/cobalt transporter CorA [Brevibacillus sp. MCWH]UFJ61693.1 magnesium/cobalt transporter CorA [Anoxybacillus sediminis]